MGYRMILARIKNRSRRSNLRLLSSYNSDPLLWVDEKNGSSAIITDSHMNVWTQLTRLDITLK